VAVVRQKLEIEKKEIRSTVSEIFNLAKVWHLEKFAIERASESLDLTN
jgi:hypothetical protein